MVSTLLDWEEKFGSNDAYTGGNSSGRFEFERDVAYFVRVKGAKIVKTKREEIQLELKLDVLDGDQVVGTSREWLTLPKQPTDEKLKAEIVRKITMRRRDDLQRILSSEPEFAIWDGREVIDGKVVHSFKGERLDFKGFREREKAANAAVMRLSDEWHDDVGSDPGIDGAEFWIVKASNPSKPQYPYTNIYNVRPEKVPVFGE